MDEKTWEEAHRLEERLASELPRERERVGAYIALMKQRRRTPRSVPP